MLSTVLAAINNSIFDDEVVKRAILTVKESSAQLHFIHSIDISVIDIEITSEYLKEKIDKKAIEKEIRQKVNMVDGSENLDYVIHITVGDTVEQVIYTAQKIRADLIILGSHSKLKIEDYYLGSTVNNIAQKSGLPILVIKNRVQGAYKNILAPTDFSSASKKNILFAQIAFFPCPIELMHVYKELDDLSIDMIQVDLNKSDKERSFVGRPLALKFKEDVKIKKLEMLKSSESIDETILEQVKFRKTELLVLGSNGSDILGSFLGSTTAYLLRNAKSDIFIYIPLNKD